MYSMVKDIFKGELAGKTNNRVIPKLKEWMKGKILRRTPRSWNQEMRERPGKNGVQETNRDFKKKIVVIWENYYRR